VDNNAHLAEHLRFFQELGVTGFSLDARWRRRAAAVPTSREIVEDTVATPALAAPVASIPVTVMRSPGVETGRDSEQSASREPRISVESASREEALAAIRGDIGDCTRCKLHKLGRRQIVFGVGNPSADLMFVGEAPGADEDMQGIPFIGRAGQLLTKIIEAIGLRRDDVYIANVIKCRPPENRNPEPDEVETCEPFLFQQIDSVQPKVIVALGTFAAKALLKTQDPISRLRGRTFEYRGATLIPTFHPAFLLRSPDRKRDVWEDMKKVRALLQEPSNDGN
jgi:uracil-DNA glycosylase